MKSVHEVIRKAETNYLFGNVKMSQYVSWSMHLTLEKVDAYLNSKFTTGETDSLGRQKPFFNIVTGATNIWFRATDLDRKDIKFIPSDNDAVILSFVANIILQNWMEKNNFGQFLNNWGRSLARYGSTIVKFVEQGGALIPSVIPWNRFIADPVQFDALPRIEKFYLTADQMRKNPLYDQAMVEAVLASVTTRKTLNRAPKDLMNDFIEIYEVHGEMDERLLQKNPDLNIPDKEATYRQQMHVVTFVPGSKKGSFDDYTLYKGKEAKDPYMITHLIEEDGRTLAIGAVEYLFTTQWMANHTVKNIKDTLDLASKLIFQTPDAQFSNRNVLTQIETGDIFVHKENQPLTRIANDKPDIGAMSQYLQQWQNNGETLTNTPPIMQGAVPHAGTSARLQGLVVAQANSLFELMTENKGLALEQMLRIFVIPHLKKQLKNTKQVVALLDDAGVKEIDALYVPQEAVKRYNQRTVQQVIDHIKDPTTTPPPAPFDPSKEEAGVQQSLTSLGNKRFFTVDELEKKTWADLFSDFEWNDIKVFITNENDQDLQTILPYLSQAFSMVVQAASQGRPLSADERLMVNLILNETGKISPLQLSTAAAQPPPQPQQALPQGGMSQVAPAGGGTLPVR